MSKVMTTAPRPFTADDLAGMPDDGYKREIIGGCLIVTPSPNTRHQIASRELLLALQRGEPPDLLVLTAPLDWHFSSADVLEPDVMVMRRVDVDPGRTPGPEAMPLLVVEILSPSNRAFDLALKRETYQNYRVPAYWVVDPMVPGILALRLGDDGCYRTEAEVDDDDEFVTDWPYPVRLRPADLVRY